MVIYGPPEWPGVKIAVAWRLQLGYRYALNHPPGGPMKSSAAPQLPFVTEFNALCLDILNEPESVVRAKFASLPREAQVYVLQLIVMMAETCSPQAQSALPVCPATAPPARGSASSGRQLWLVPPVQDRRPREGAVGSGRILG